MEWLLSLLGGDTTQTSTAGQLGSLLGKGGKVPGAASMQSSQQLGGDLSSIIQGLGGPAMGMPATMGGVHPSQPLDTQRQQQLTDLLKRMGV